MAEEMSGQGPIIPPSEGGNQASPAGGYPPELTDEEAVLAAARKIVGDVAAMDVPVDAPLPASEFGNAEAVTAAADSALREGMNTIAGEQLQEAADHLRQATAFQQKKAALSEDASARVRKRAMRRYGQEIVRGGGLARVHGGGGSKISRRYGLPRATTEGQNGGKPEDTASESDRQE